jgi:predicted MFS family arabinose efflux permease
MNVPENALKETAETEFNSHRMKVAASVFLALLFDGFELGLMPVASLSVTKSLAGAQASAADHAEWFAWLTAALMLGAAAGGIIFGMIGDRFGRVPALGGSILFYSIFAGMGGIVTNLEQMLILRFMVGLGVGGVWPNGISLASEFWPELSKPLLSGVLGSAINVGILILSQVARLHPITPDSWRWLFAWCGLPALLGLVVIFVLPESPAWLRSRETQLLEDDSKSKKQVVFSRELFPVLFLAILLGTIPLVGAWAASKWMIPWADSVAGSSNPGYKAVAQGWWALGASMGGFLGAIIAGRLGAARSFALFGIISTVMTSGLFLFTRPMTPLFLPIVFFQGLCSTMFFGWLPLYLPMLFPTGIRATGTGISYNVGRFLTAFGVLASSYLVRAFSGDYAAIGAAAGLIYALAVPASLVYWRLKRE